MTWQATTWAADQKTGSAPAKLLLLVLANRANEHGECWPSIALVAAEAEMSVRAAKVHLASLRERGLLDWEQQSRADGSRSVNRYRLPIAPPRADPAPPSADPARGSARGARGSARGALQEEQSIEQSSNSRVRDGVQISHPADLAPPQISHPTDASIAADFKAWYQAYPKRVDRGRATTAYAKARKKASAEDLLTGARAYAEARRGQDPKFTKQPATWLNAESWLDEPEPTQQRRIPGMSVWGDDITTPPPGHIEGMGVWDL